MAKVIKQEDLTPEFYAELEIRKNEMMAGLYNGQEHETWQKRYSEEYVDLIYKSANEPVPAVIIANNLREFAIYYNTIFNSNVNQKTRMCINVIASLKTVGVLKTKDIILKDGDNQTLIENFGVDFNKFTSEEDLESIKAKFEEEFYKISNEIPRETILKNYLNPTVNQFYLASEYGRIYLIWYELLDKHFNLEADEATTQEYLAFKAITPSNNIAKAYFSEKAALILRMPKKIRTIMSNDTEIFHSTTDASIEYPGEKLYYVNNRQIEEEWFLKTVNKTLTFEEFIQIENEDLKAGIATIIKENEGNEGLLKFLNAELVDTKEVTHNSGYTETIKLYKTKQKFTYVMNRFGERNQPYAWMSLVCPSTGQNYLIDTCPSFKDAVEAAKWHRPKNIPMDLPYVWQSAN